MPIRPAIPIRAARGRRTNLLALCLLAVFTTPAGADPAADEAALESADRRLCELVADAPISLDVAIRRAANGGRRVFSARYALDAGGGLTLEVRSAGAADDAADYEVLGGAVTVERWTASSRAVEGNTEIARAAREQMLLVESGADLGKAAGIAGSMRPGPGRTLGALVSLRPVRDGKSLAIEALVTVDGLPYRALLAAADLRVVRLDAPDWLQRREEAARRWTGRALPELDVPAGEWLNCEAPVRLAELRGKIVLVVVTDPG